VPGGRRSAVPAEAILRVPSHFSFCEESFLARTLRAADVLNAASSVVHRFPLDGTEIAFVERERELERGGASSIRPKARSDTSRR
jgi:hypothetical protein